MFSSSAIMTLGGLASGVLLALPSTRLLATLLSGVTAMDVGTFAAVAVVLLTAAGGASYVPAHRATRISAAAALRAES